MAAVRLPDDVQLDPPQTATKLPDDVKLDAPTQAPKTPDIPGEGYLGMLQPTLPVAHGFVSGLAGEMTDLPKDQTGFLRALGETGGQMVRGAVDPLISMGKRAVGAGEAGDNPLRPLKQDEIMALASLVMSPGEAGGAALSEQGKPPILALSREERAANLATKPPETAPSGPTTTPVSKVAQKAADTISNRFETGSIGGGNAADVLTELTKARKEGQPLALVDLQATNQDIKGLVGTIYRQGGEAAAKLKAFLENRNKGATERVQKLINEQLSDQSMKDTAKKLVEARSSAARPLWSEAENVKPVWSPYLDRLLQNPKVREGIQRGLAIERDKADGLNIPFDPKDYSVTSFNEAGEPVLEKVPNMKLWMVAKEGLDAIAESPGMRNELTGRPTKAGNAVLDLRNGVLGELDKLNPKYKAAREQWSGDTASIRALDEGKHLFDNNWFTLEEVLEKWAALPEGDRQFFLLGVATKLKEKLYAKVDAADKGSVINNEDTRARLRPLFQSPELADRFLDAVERERTMKQTPARIYGGSDTAERLAASKREAATHIAEAVRKVASGGWAGVPGAARSVYKAVRGLQDRPDPALNNAIVEMLTDPNIVLGVNKGLPLVPAEANPLSELIGHNGGPPLAPPP
jgi:hypothetical protein